MKLIRINTITITTLFLVLLGSCGKDFITLEPKGQFLTENYYKDRSQAYSGLVAAYDILRKNAGGFENMICMMNAGSDDNYAGGGGATDGAGIQGFSNDTISAQIIPRSFWSDFYQGVFRSNILLAKLPGTSMDASEKARFVAETK